MLSLILEIFVEAAIIVLVSTFIAADSFVIHAAICAACFIFAIVGGLRRGEDEFVSESGQRRYFMNFGHASVWAFFVGILILALK